MRSKIRRLEVQAPIEKCETTKLLKVWTMKTRQSQTPRSKKTSKAASWKMKTALRSARRAEQNHVASRTPRELGTRTAASATTVAMSWSVRALAAEPWHTTAASTWSSHRLVTGTARSVL